MRPLILTGGPAVGKSTCGRALASSQARGAFIDADDVRQLVVAGDATLWSGPEGELQHELAARNVASLARNFSADGFDVVIADFVTPGSLAAYRSLLPDCFVVHLAILLKGALERAATREVYLTDDEFALLHRMAESPPAADLTLDVDGLLPDGQTDALRIAWSFASGHRTLGTADDRFEVRHEVSGER